MVCQPVSPASTVPATWHQKPPLTRFISSILAWPSISDNATPETA
jgi:hypothetical protein